MDLDVSIMEQPNCKKEGVSWTYHEVMGYAPIFCYLGTNAYMLGNELRNGSQHSIPGTNDFIQRCFNKSDSFIPNNEGYLKISKIIIEKLENY